MEFEGEAADEAEELFGDQKQKNPGCYPGLICFVAVCVVLGLFALVLSSGEHEPTTSDKVADILTGAYYDGAPNTYAVQLSENSNTTYGGEADSYLDGGDCEITITYEAGGDGLTEFATATTHTPKCRVAYSVDTVGYFEDWVYPDTQITYTSDDPGFPIRAIAFAACMPQHNGDPIPNCTIVKMGGQSD